MRIPLAHNWISLALTAVIAWAMYRMGAVMPIDFFPVFAGLACLFVCGVVGGLRVGLIGWILLVPLLPMLAVGSTPEALLLHIAFWIAVMLAIHQVKRDATGSSNTLLYGLMTVGLLEALFGLSQSLIHYSQFMPTSLEFRSGTFYNRNYFAGMLEMIAPIFVTIGLSKMYHRRPRKIMESSGRFRHGSSRRHGRFVPISSTSDRFALAWLFLLGGAVIFLAILFSLSRGGIIACAAGTMSAILLLAVREQQKQLSNAFVRILAVCFVAAVLAGALWIGLNPVIERYQQTSVQQEGRLPLWRDTIKLIGDHPWLGVGGGMYRWDFRRYQTFAPDLLILHAHNDYLHAAAEWGIPAALIFFGAIFFMLARAVGAAFRAEDPARLAVLAGGIGGITAFLVHSITDFNLHVPSNALAFAALLGTTYGLARKTEVSIIEPQASGVEYRVSDDRKQASAVKVG